MPNDPARMSYSDYLDLDRLLGAQHPLSDAHDEMVQRDLVLIYTRNYLDPKRFCKNPNAKKGTVVDDNHQLLKQEQWTNLVDEVLANPEVSGML